MIWVKMNMYFWGYIKKLGFQFWNSWPAPYFSTHFTNTHFLSKNTNRGLRKRIKVCLNFSILSHPKSCVYFQSISQKDIYLQVNTKHSNLSGVDPGFDVRGDEIRQGVLKTCIYYAWIYGTSYSQVRALLISSQKVSKLYGEWAFYDGRKCRR